MNAIPDKNEPCEKLQRIWVSLRKRYFPLRADLDTYFLRWSYRAQKHTLASCNFDIKRVIVARELNNPRYAKWLRPLLYHEMCHAVLKESVKRSRKRFAWHGKEFKHLEARHPKSAELNDWMHNGGWERVVKMEKKKKA